MNFPPGQASAEAPLDPPYVTITIDQIHSEYNPRRAPNPRYDDILESILATGMKQPFSVTRRPGSDLYTQDSGGKTRLDIHHVLWERTGDERFYRLTLPFVPWPGDKALRFGHAIENSSRGDMTFLDSALMVRDLTEFVVRTDPDFADRPATQQVEAFRKEGFVVTRTTLGAYDYAVRTLAKHLPVALESGLGRPSVEEIRRTERSLRECVARQDETLVEAFDAEFVRTLSEFDSSKFDLRGFIKAFGQRIAVLRGVSAEAAARGETDPNPRSRKSAKSRSSTSRTKKASTKRAPHPTSPPVASPDSIEQIRAEASGIALALAADNGFLTSYATLSGGTVALGFVLESPDASGLHHDDVDPARIAVYWMLYQAFWCALELEIEAGMLEDVDIDDVVRDIRPDDVRRSETYRDAMPFLAAVRARNLIARARAGVARDGSMVTGERLDRLGELSGAHALHVLSVPAPAASPAARHEVSDHA